MHYQSEFQKYNSTQYGFYNNITNLADGTYTYYGWANDTAGNSNQTETRTLTVDTTSPTVNLMSPANNTLETSTNLITLNYNTTNATSNVANCSLYLNSVLNETDTSITEGVTQNFTKTLANGYYNWSVSCRDSPNNLGTSATWFLNVSTNAPNVILVSPENDTTDTDGNVTFTCNVTDDNTLVNITSDSDFKKLCTENYIFSNIYFTTSQIDLF